MVRLKQHCLLSHADITSVGLILAQVRLKLHTIGIHISNISQAVFLAYMVVLKHKPNVAVSAVLIILTVFIKMRYASPLLVAVFDLTGGTTTA
jgi:hypothetical protein